MEQHLRDCVFLINTLDAFIIIIILSGKRMLLHLCGLVRITGLILYEINPEAFRKMFSTKSEKMFQKNFYLHAQLL